MIRSGKLGTIGKTGRSKGVLLLVAASVATLSARSADVQPARVASAASAEQMPLVLSLSKDEFGRRARASTGSARAGELLRESRRPTAGLRQQHSRVLAGNASPYRALVNQYCVACHNQKTKTAGLALDTLDFENVPANADIWEKVIRKLGAGMMPPVGRPRPTPERSHEFQRWLSTKLDQAAQEHPNPGRTEAFHRLNRAEYHNAIHDMLALEIDVDSTLPADEASYGFDNNAGVQRMSPTLMDRYLLAAERITRAAIGLPGVAPNVDLFRVEDDLAQDDRLEGLPFGTRGGTVIPYNFPSNGEYVIEVKLARSGGVANIGEDIFPYDRPQPLEVTVDGERVHVFTLEAVEPKDRRARGGVGRRDLDADWQVRFAAKAGPHQIGVTFLNRTPALPETLVRPLRPYGAGQGVALRQGAYLRSVEVSGPFAASGSGDTPSRNRIFVCRPVRASEETPCARTILSTLARRAYRRPVTDADLNVLEPFFRAGQAKGGFESGIERALQTLLVMPEFLFRVERDPVHVERNTVYRVGDLELTSRLSFFLWGSIPDDQLLDVATRGTLREPPVLDREVRRMLADPRASKSLVSNFAGQWLSLRNVASVRPDPAKDPDFDDSLRAAFRRETELFLESIVQEDRSVIELLTADYTFVNERLARHYGIPNVMGTHFRRVKLTDINRRGLLGQGSVLALTSYPHRTSPVLRGKWILESLLGTPPPPPPPNVPDLKDTNPDGKVLTMRDRMTQHRANPVCASCHAMMDPPGFALENFDFVGRWQSHDESRVPIDASGTLPDGTRFDGVVGLREALLKNRELFVATMTEKLLTFALGRGVEYYDAPAVRKIVRDASEHDFRFSSLVFGVVNSLPFQMRRSQP